MKGTIYRFSQRGTGKANNNDAALFANRVHLDRVHEHGEVDPLQGEQRPVRYFWIEGSNSGEIQYADDVL